MKKFSFLVALLAVMAFATSAFAAQPIAVKNSVYPTEPESVITYKATPKVFNADGNTNYPYEIYLPNEATPANYRIHSNYTKNTDACAACHATHTAVGNSLLQWYTVYDTCMACHDGTIATTYNVQEGEIGTGKPTFGGMFGTGTEGSLSNHNVTGAMEIAAAPGGSVVAETSNVEGDAAKAKTRWASEFGCESCHTPHGQGGNARILHPDANWAATASRGTGEYFMDVAGYVYKDAGFTKPAYLLKGYPYSPAIYNGATKISGVTFDNSTGVTRVVYANLPVVTKVTGTAALQVKMQISNYLNGATEDVKHVSGMNGFCGACHTDYNTEGFVNPETLKVNAGSAEFETGTYSKAHRHQVGFTYSSPTKASVVNAKLKFEGTATMECLTCHVAHGASLDYWKRTVGDVADGGNGYIATADLVEFAGSSALKRIPNMGTCEACHAKGDGNEGYGVNSMAEANYAGKTASKGVANTPNYDKDSTILDEAGYYSTGKIFAPFLNADGTGFFADEPFVGSAKCEDCHKEYYEGWEKSHAESFVPGSEKAEIAAEFAKFAGQTNVTASSVVEDNTMATFGNRVTYTIDSFTANSMTWTASGTTYTVNLSDVDYVWMNHYLLKTIDAANGIYKRVATWDEHAPAGQPKLKPIFDRKTALPAKQSFVSWWATVAADGSSASGNAAEGCLSCHAPQMQNAQGTPDITISCESCHGPASRHVAAPSSANILNPKTKLTFEQQQNLCLTCHSGGHNALSTFKSSDHFTNDVGCTTCHDVHNTVKGDGEHSSLKVSETVKNAVCSSCHDTVIDVETYFANGVENVKSGSGLPTMWTRHGFDAPIE